MTSSPAQQPSPQLFFSTINAYQRTEALKAAIELEVFTAIGEGNTSAGEIANRCETSERGMRILCDFLCIMGFLEKAGERYPRNRFDPVAPSTHSLEQPYLAYQRLTRRRRIRQGLSRDASKTRVLKPEQENHGEPCHAHDICGQWQQQGRQHERNDRL